VVVPALNFVFTPVYDVVFRRLINIFSWEIIVNGIWFSVLNCDKIILAE
jgi:hypothetical protein